MSNCPTSVLTELRHKRIALLGLGVENLALARFFHCREISFSVLDARDAVMSGEEDWCGSLHSLIAGEEYLDHLNDFELIFRTPGISTLSPQLWVARDHGVVISTQTRLFLSLSVSTVLGVTGTKGKGTTLSLVASMLQGGEFPRVLLGGNIGTPPIEFVEELRPEDLVALELSSFQLQDLDRSPSLGVVLGIHQDHLDYHEDLAEYVAAKSSICAFQESGDQVIFNIDCERARQIAGLSLARRRWTFSINQEVESGSWSDGRRIWLRRPDARACELCGVGEIRLRGRHNLANAAAAVATAAAAGAEEETIVAALRSFDGLPHRMEEVGLRDGVLYVNDSLATTPEATVAALESYQMPVVLIAGGASKGADFGPIGKAVVAAPVRAIILLGREADRLEEAISARGFGGVVVRDCEDMAMAVSAARCQARCGDVVLLSPGCASFDMFAGYADRGNLFKCLVLE